MGIYLTRAQSSEHNYNDWEGRDSHSAKLRRERHDKTLQLTNRQVRDRKGLLPLIGNGKFGLAAHFPLHLRPTLFSPKRTKVK